MLAEGLALARSEEPPSRREARAAVAIAGALYFVGALLCATATLLPHVSSPAGVTGVALDALLTAALLGLAAARGWGGLGLALAADLWGVLVIAVLCASSGGATSPFALIYLFAIGHAAAYQPRWRFLLVSAAALIAFLLPLAYQSHVSSTFAAVACVGIVLALLGAVVVHFSLNRLREQRRLMKALISASGELDRSLDPAQTLRTIARAAVPNLAEMCAIDLPAGNGARASTLAAAVEPGLAVELERIRRDAPVDPRGPHPVALALAGDTRRVIRDLADAGSLPAGSMGDLDEPLLREAGYARSAVFPMIARGRTVGAISFMHMHAGARYDGGLLAVLEDLAGRAGMAFDNARLYDERAKVARTLRRSLMPPVLPSIPGLELASYFRSSGTGNEVGGDFYDVFGDRDGRWLVVGDVCGKGAEAAALTAFLRHTTAAYAREGGDPGQVLTQVNRAMLEQDFDGRFATAILARIRSRGAALEVTVALAGHPAALLIRAGRSEVGELGGSGTLLGVFEDPLIEEASTVLEPGDSLALYTDGLSEARAPAHVVSVQEMIEQLERAAPASARDTIDALLALIGPDDGVRDDIAILSAQVRSGAGAASANGGRA